ncbi:MAG: 30S ribosomal protein S11 [Parcubacteria group bacterium]|nr:30S ribosomal protein S11 [Parcubacteria group bacterium]
MGKKRIIQKEDAAAEKSSDGKDKAPVSTGRRGAVGQGRVYIQASYNNTLISLTDDSGNLIAQSSAGALGFKGPKKATPYAANRVIETLGEKMRKVGLKDVAVLVRGIGSGREAAVRALVGQGLNITSIKDITPIPHNGPKPPKPRRT